MYDFISAWVRKNVKNKNKKATDKITCFYPSHVYTGESKGLPEKR